MEAKHTPGPLTAFTSETVTEDRIQIMQKEAGFIEIGDDINCVALVPAMHPEAEANAARIILTWNCHDDLLAAVEHLIHYAEKLESAADLGKETGNITLDKYRELVAKAKGPQCYSRPA